MASLRPSRGLEYPSRVILCPAVFLGRRSFDGLLNKLSAVVPVCDCLRPDDLFVSGYSEINNCPRSLRARASRSLRDQRYRQAHSDGNANGSTGYHGQPVGRSQTLAALPLTGAGVDFAISASLA